MKLNENLCWIKKKKTRCYPFSMVWMFAYFIILLILATILNLQLKKYILWLPKILFLNVTGNFFFVVNWRREQMWKTQRNENLKFCIGYTKSIGKKMEKIFFIKKWSYFLVVIVCLSVCPADPGLPVQTYRFVTGTCHDKNYWGGRSQEFWKKL